MKKYLLMMLCTLVLSAGFAQKKNKEKVEAKQEVKVDSTWRSITLPKVTQDRLTGLRDRYEELVGLEKLIKKNDDLKLDVQQRILAVSREYDSQYRTLYETNRIEAFLVKRDSLAGETLWLKFDSPKK